MTDDFAPHRAVVHAVAYRMLGSLDDADDVVQETWLRWARTDRGAVTDPRGYLVRIATRAAIDVRRRVATRREAYAGTWLPEPVLTDPDRAEVAEEVSYAMLVVLETLSPLERAVFVLREAFGFDYAEVAAAVGRAEPAVRQLAHRAREHVRARQPRYPADRAVGRAATERFMRAAVGGDLAALLDVLAPDVTLVCDGGGKAPAPRRPINGADRVARFFAGTAPDVPAGTAVRHADVNGEQWALAVVGGTAYAVFVLGVDPGTGRISAIHLVANPDKLRGVR